MSTRKRNRDIAFWKRSRYGSFFYVLIYLTLRRGHLICCGNGIAGVDKMIEYDIIMISQRNDC